MDFHPAAMSDEEMLQIVDQWEAEGLLDPSWMQTQGVPFPTSSTASSSSSTTPSESSHRNSFPFPTSDPGSTSTILFSPTLTEAEPEDATPTASNQLRPSRDPAKRKQQNRNAQRAHRDRQKNLIRDLWAEVHSLRLQNKQLLDLKLESHELKAANGRLRAEIEAMERIWVEAVTHGETG